MIKQITNDLNKKMRAGRLAQARKQLIDSFENRADAEVLADAVISLTHHLSFISLEERLLVGSKVDPLGYAKQLQALAVHAEQWEYVTPHDLEVGDALAAIRKL